MKEKTEGSLIVLNRSIVIGIIVLITTISFAFGYFVGRYSLRDTKKSESGVLNREEEAIGPKEEHPPQIQPPVEAPSVELSDKPVAKKEQERPEPPKTAPEITKKQPPEIAQKSEKSPKELLLQKGAYYLQIGAFKDQNRAIKLKEGLNKETHNVIIKKEGTVHKVFLGPFKTRREALLEQTRIRKLYTVDSIIVKE